MNVALWTAQIALAVVFAVSGIAKSTMSKERLIASGQTGVAPFPPALIRFTAVSELLGVVGLVGPWLTGIAPVLTPTAAVGLSIVMIGALGSHGRLLRADLAAGRGAREAVNVAANITIFAMCMFVAVGRF
jgi:hypothetical protein